MIDTRLLVYFLSIAREQNFTRAAESLNITQPTLSKQMAQLEEQLGKRLFNRSRGTSVSLTEEGEYLRVRAQEIIELLNVTEDAIRMESENIGGDITIGCGETPVMGFLTEIMKEIHDLYPDIRFHTFSGDAQNVCDRLDKGLIDVGLMLGPHTSEKYDYIDLKMKDRFGLLMPTEHPLAEKEVLHLGDMKDVPLALPQQLTNGQEHLAHFDLDLGELHTVATYNLIYNATFLVEQGICLAFCLENLVSTDGSRNLTFRSFDPDITTDACLVTKKYQVFSPAVKIFLDTLKSRLSITS